MNILELMNKRHGSIHWWVERSIAVLLIPFIAWLILTSISLPSLTLGTVIDNIFMYNKYLLLLFTILLFIHIRIGIQVLVDDYVHNHFTKEFLFLCLNILTIEGIRYIYIYFILVL